MGLMTYFSGIKPAVNALSDHFDNILAQCTRYPTTKKLKERQSEIMNKLKAEACSNNSIWLHNHDYVILFW